MSSKKDEDQAIEKIRHYPDLTVNDCSTTKSIVSSSNAITVSNSSSNPSKTNHSISIGPISSSQNVDETRSTTCSELRQAVERNAWSPYINDSTSQTSNRVSRVTQSKTPVKVSTPQKVVSEKSPTESTIATPAIFINKAVARTRPNVTFNSVPVSRQISITPPKGDRVALVNTTGSVNESNCILPKSLPDQILQHQLNKSPKDIFERNIHKNVLSVSPCASKVTSSLKDTKVSPTATVSRAVSTSPTPKNTAPVKDNANVNAIRCSGKAEISTTQSNNIKSASSNIISKPVILSTSELSSRNLVHNAPSAEVNVCSPSEVKHATTVISSTECNSRSINLNQKSIPSKTVPPTISSCINKINLKPRTSSTPLQLKPVSSFPDNKEMMDALNSGSDVQLTNSVTISNNAPVSYSFVQEESDSKLGNLNDDAAVQLFSKQIVGIIPQGACGNFRNKSGNAEIVGGGNPNPSGSSPKESSSPSSSRDLRSGRLSGKESVTLIRKNPAENEDVAVESRRNSPQEAEKCDVQESVHPPSQRKMEEPECLTISSDEDESEEAEPHVSSYSDASDLSVSIASKEPPVIGAYDDKLSDTEINTGDKESVSELDITTGSGYSELCCRSIRIGSYKFMPDSPVIVSKYGIRLVVPIVRRPSERVVVKIPMIDIKRVLIHKGRKLPVIFYHVSPQQGAKVRNLLKMTNKNECYFNPHSKDESQRRITLLLGKLSDISIGYIIDLYIDHEILADLNFREANELLMKSSPRENRDIQKLMKQVPPNPVQTIMVYPPPPAKGGISINTEDYSCLAEDVFLNDVIIDFFLKYLYNERLSEEDRQKTHIFSSFFYKRLTDKATPIPRDLHNLRSDEATITPEEIRHSRVIKWTKNIDLFSKDYIIIPLNENQHWFLAIICFPGLKGPVRFSDNLPIETAQSGVKIEKADSSTTNVEDETMFIGSTSITPIRPEFVPKYAPAEEEGDDADERDEADGAEEDVNLYMPMSEDSEGESETELPASGDAQRSTSRSKPEVEPIKQPCILIFDSLAGASRARIIATLRDYLRVEYKVKHNEDRDFSKNVVKGACPRVPQQNNYTDCGLFVLQYVESFFENKVTDFHIPIKSLRNWFDPDNVGRKRYDIQQLLHRLMSEQNIDINSLHLPQLNLSLDSDDDGSDDDFDIDDHYGDEDDFEMEDDRFDDEDEDEDVMGHLDEDIDDEEEGELDQSFDYGGMSGLEDEDEDGIVTAGMGGRAQLLPVPFRGGEIMARHLRKDSMENHLFRRRHRYYRTRPTHAHHHLHQQQRLAVRSHAHRGALPADQPAEYLEDDDDRQPAFDNGAPHSRFDVFDAEFDMDAEDSASGNEEVSEPELYNDLDDVEQAMETRKRNAVKAGLATAAARCRNSGAASSASPSTAGTKSWVGGRVPPTRGTHASQLVEYDDDDDDDDEESVGGSTACRNADKGDAKSFHAAAADERVAGRRVCDDADDDAHDVEDDDELAAGYHRVDDEANDEVELQREAVVDEMDELVLANEKLSALNPAAITVSRTPLPVAMQLPRRRPAPPAAKEAANAAPAVSSTGSPGVERSQLAALKAARPFGEVDSSDASISSNKKFRSS